MTARRAADYLCPTRSRNFVAGYESRAAAPSPARDVTIGDPTAGWLRFYDLEAEIEKRRARLRRKARDASGPTPDAAAEK